jgi:hypothetical protein
VGTHGPQCVMCVVKGTRWAMEGVWRSQGQRGERFATFRKAAEGCSPTLALA